MNKRVPSSRGSDGKRPQRPSSANPSSPFRSQRPDRPRPGAGPGRTERPPRGSVGAGASETGNQRPERSQGFRGRPARSERPGRPARFSVRPNRTAAIEREARVAETPTPPAQLAARIIARCNARQPADLLLRQTLARRRALTPDQAAWISRAVFAYFRWQHWLDSNQTLEERVESALGLAQRFSAGAGWPSDAELLEKAIPSWVAEEGMANAAWVRSLQKDPVLWLRARPGSAAVLTQAFGPEALVPGPLPDSFRYSGSSDLFVTPEFQEGLFEIQDIASQAVGHVCSPRPGEVWWDACAGEGGKTLHLAAMMEGKGLVWASDRAAWRLDRLKQRAARAHCFNHRRVEWDGGAEPPTPTEFDGVLVDAPCSGMGTWGRNPHARWTTTPTDVQELAAIQRNLLRHVAPTLKSGGRLVYSVCTLSPAETTAIAEDFTAQHPEFEPHPFANPFDLKADPAAAFTFWPQDTGGNGMFVAVWERRLKAAPVTPTASA